MSEGNIASIFTGSGGQDELVLVLEDMLAAARAGEMIGFGFIAAWADRSNTYDIHGYVNGYGFLGASTCLAGDVERFVRGED